MWEVEVSWPRAVTTSSDAAAGGRLPPAGPKAVVETVDLGPSWAVFRCGVYIVLGSSQSPWRSGPWACNGKTGKMEEISIFRCSWVFVLFYYCKLMWIDRFMIELAYLARLYYVRCLKMLCIWEGNVQITQWTQSAMRTRYTSTCSDNCICFPGPAGFIPLTVAFPASWGNGYLDFKLWAL